MLGLWHVLNEQVYAAEPNKFKGKIILGQNPLLELEAGLHSGPYVLIELIIPT